MNKDEAETLFMKIKTCPAADMAVPVDMVGEIYRANHVGSTVKWFYAAAAPCIFLCDLQELLGLEITEELPGGAP